MRGAGGPSILTFGLGFRISLEGVRGLPLVQLVLKGYGSLLGQKILLHSAATKYLPGNFRAGKEL